MTNSFNLENNISQFSNYADQIRLISKSFFEGNIDEDKLLGALEGVAILIELHENKTFDSFKRSFKLDEYSNRL